MQLPSPQHSRAVLVGSSVFDYLDDLPAVRNNIEALEACLLDKELWGIDRQNVSRSMDPVDEKSLLDLIHTAAEEATDTLIVYYAGHGIVNRRGNLMLALKGSDPRKWYSAADFDRIRQLVIESPAERRVVIMDCCYSGRALGTMSSSQSHADLVAQAAEAEGTFVLAASAENMTALAPVNEKYTAFTGELVRLFDQGHPDAPEFWDLDSLYRTLRRELRAKGRPEPQRRDRNSIGELRIARNRAKLASSESTTPDRGLQAGATLSERYELQRLIATGTASQVWEAQDNTDPRRVAVKILLPEFSDDPEFGQRFRVGARAIALLNHPNIASVYGYGESETDRGRVVYLVMELVEGEPLSSVLERTGRLSLADSLDMLEQTGRALQMVHGAGLVHRDVTPGHILITSDRRVKLIGFKISSGVDSAAISSGVDSAAVAGTGTAIGGAQYVSLEQVLGHDATAASDVYSLGVVAYESLSGRPAFPDGRVTKAPTDDVRETLPKLPADLPEPVHALVETAMAQDPAMRYRDGGQFADAVAAVVAGYRPEFPDLQSDGQPGDAALAEQYAEARENLDRQQWQAAADLFAAIEQQQPGYREAAELHAEAQRQCDMAVWSERATAAAKADDWDGAVTALEKLIGLDSAYPDAGSRLAQARAARRRKDLLNEVTALHRAGRWQEVVAAEEEFVSLDPDHPDPDGVFADSRAKLREADLADRYQHAVNQFTQRHWQQAVEMLTAIEQEQSGFRDASTLITKAQQELTAAKDIKADSPPASPEKSPQSPEACVDVKGAANRQDSALGPATGIHEWSDLGSLIDSDRRLSHQEQQDLLGRLKSDIQSNTAQRLLSTFCARDDLDQDIATNAAVLLDSVSEAKVTQSRFSRSFLRDRRRAAGALVIILVVVVVVAAVVTAVLYNANPSRVAERKLTDLVAEDLFGRDCKSGPYPPEALAGVACAEETGLGGGSPTYYLFADQTALNNYFDSLHFVQSCPGASAAVQNWHRAGDVLAGGLVGCIVDGDGAPSVWWTDDARLLVGNAPGRDGTTIDQVYRWWHDRSQGWLN
ncbi:protein kinase [Mycobacterium sp. NPDC048908]|uniref:caspase, EACC1-associated type n=1 Tax=Mycobacterium sp. NPDC048908 TaxID=3364292 RepID=UPI00371D8F1C